MYGGLGKGTQIQRTVEERRWRGDETWHPPTVHTLDRKTHEDVRGRYIETYCILSSAWNSNNFMVITRITGYYICWRISENEAGISAQ